MHEGGEEDEDEVPIAEATFHPIQSSLRKLYMDAGVPGDVRRRILEASVRAPQDWQPEAIRAAYGSGDDAWRFTAVFCMRFIRGFDEQILESLRSTKYILVEQILAWDNELFRRDLGPLPEPLQDEVRRALLEFLDCYEASLGDSFSTS